MNLFTRIFAENEPFNWTSYKIVHKIAARAQPFNGGNFIKAYVMEEENKLRPERAAFFANICFSASLVVQITWWIHSATDSQKATCGILWLWLSLLISRLRHNFSYLFVVLMRTFRSHTIWHLFAASTKQQSEKTFSWKCRKLCINVLQLIEGHGCSEEGLVGQIRNKL